LLLQYPLVLLVMPVLVSLTLRDDTAPQTLTAAPDRVAGGHGH
jgi:hypothetical protein